MRVFRRNPVSSGSRQCARSDFDGVAMRRHSAKAGGGAIGLSAVGAPTMPKANRGAHDRHDRRSPRCRHPASGERAHSRSAPRRLRERSFGHQAALAAGDRGQPSRRDQPAQTRVQLGRPDPVAGGSVGPRAADPDGLGQRSLGPPRRSHRRRRGAGRARRLRRRAIRLASAVSACRIRTSGP